MLELTKKVSILSLVSLQNKYWMIPQFLYAMVCDFFGGVIITISSGHSQIWKTQYPILEHLPNLKEYQ